MKLNLKKSTLQNTTKSDNNNTKNTLFIKFYTVKTSLFANFWLPVLINKDSRTERWWEFLALDRILNLSQVVLSQTRVFEKVIMDRWFFTFWLDVVIENKLSGRTFYG